MLVEGKQLTKKDLTDYVEGINPRLKIGSLLIKHKKKNGVIHTKIKFEKLYIGENYIKNTDIDNQVLLKDIVSLSCVN